MDQTTSPSFTVEYIESPPAAEPMPDEFATHRVRRSVLILAAVVLAVVVVVTLLPGLGSVRNTFKGARPGWLVAAGALQLLSCLSYVLVFRGVFCRVMRWVTSYEIATAELAANSLLSVGGAGGLALGAWILRRGGLAGAEIARRTVAFFLLTSVANFVAAIVVGIALALGLLDSNLSPAAGLVPAAGAAAVMALVPLARPAATRLARRSQHRRLSAALESVAGGVDEAIVLLRSRSLLVLGGSFGYMLFDVASLWVCFKAFGLPLPAGGVVLLAYLIGQLGGLIPIPGGIGGIDGGLIGTLVLYGIGATQATVAVLAYRALALWLPLALGVPSMVSLRRRLRREEHDIKACAPGDEVDVIGRGRVPAAALGR